MLIKIVDDIKQQFQTSMDSTFKEIKNNLSSNILNIELAFLYQNKIYGLEAHILQEKFTELSINIDDILNRHKTDCMDSVVELLNELVSSKIT